MGTTTLINGASRGEPFTRRLWHACSLGGFRGPGPPLRLLARGAPGYHHQVRPRLPADLDLLLATPHYIVERLKRDRAREFCPRLVGHVVDVGSGRSPYRDLLSGATRYTAVEADAQCRPHVVAQAADLPFASETVDGVMLTEVLEHLAEPSAALDEAWRILRPRGCLYVTVPMTWGLHYIPHDYYRFTGYGISHLVAKAGFELEALEPMGGLFAIISARLAAVASTVLLENPLRRMGVDRGRLRMSALALAGFNLPAFYASRVLDRFWREDVFAWALLARKPGSLNHTRATVTHPWKSP